MTSHPVSGTLDQQVGAAPISRAQIKLRDGSELSLRDVTVRADSVIGYTETLRERRAQSVADVASIDRTALSVGRTVTLLYLIGTVLGAAALSSAQ